MVAPALLRPSVRGKFFYLGEDKFYVRGVTYGTFRPTAEHGDFPATDVVERDFAMMSANGVNTVRTYTVPPTRVLDAAVRHGLRILVGLAWPEHKAVLDSRKQAEEVVELVRSGVRACAGHPAVFGYAVGNEVPASLVRWHGARKVEAFIERLYRVAKLEDPDALVTYINYPSTEYLDLPFLDWVGFNVYLESQPQLRSYIGRLQNLAGERPLVMTELGLDSRRHGEDAQAESLAWQIETAFAGGCAGTFVYAWTDEWHRGGHDIEDWDFGVTTRARAPKPALASLRRAYEHVPVSFEAPPPRISVVVCTYNGARTLDDCLSGIARLNYPNYETIVVNDGSTDATPEIAARYDVRLISTRNRGLSAARNTGLEAATGEIVAYIDDDARPDPEWLAYMAKAFQESDHAGIGGPNLAPSGDGLVAEGVANSPGGPMHVLLSDEVAEHIPGCNMAFRKDALEAVGGFDPRFRTAGDDVDICWRLQARGWTLGFHPAAVVWHHRRNSLRAYWRQQVGYGRAEALLEEKWPERYNRTGHLTWSGRIYGRGLTHVLGRVRRLYHGTWGTAAFQGAEERDGASMWSLPLMPEWYLLVFGGVFLTLLGLTWQPLLFVGAPILAVGSLLLVVQAWLSARKPDFMGSWWRRGRLRALTFLLHLLQPLARLRGRQRFGLTPWRSRIKARPVLPRPRSLDYWTGDWHPIEAELGRLQRRLRRRGAAPQSNRPHDRWDLQVNAGALAGARLRLAVEEHGAGVQRWMLRIWPVVQPATPVLLLFLGVPGAGAAFDGSYVAAGVLLALSGFVLLKAVFEVASAMGAILASLSDEDDGKDRDDAEDLSEFDIPAPEGVASEGSASFRYIPRLLPYLKPYWRLVTVSVVLTFAVTAFGLALPWPMQVLLDNVLAANPPSPMLGFLPDSVLNDRENLLWFAILSGFALALLHELMVVLSNFMSTKIEQRMALDLRGDLFSHAQRMSMAFHDRRRSGSLIYAINFQASSAVGILTAIPPMLQSLLTLIGMFVILATIDLYLGLLSLAVVPLLYLYITYYAGNVQKRLRHVKRLEARSLSIIHEAMAMVRVICAFGREGYEFNRFRTQGEEAVDARVNVTLRQTLFTLAVNATTAGGTAVVLGFGAMRALDGGISPGQMIVAVSYLAAVYKPLERLSYTIGGLQERFVSTQLAFRLKDTEPDIEDKPGAMELDRATGHVRYEGVSFSYRQRSRTLQNVSFEAPAGSFVGIIGPTGAGKTTLISLLPRFYEPTSGRILLDGHDIRDLTIASLRRQVSIVLQEPLLFTGSIADNIRYGRLDASDSEVIEAARAANAHEFISNLKRGYETPVGERGVQLSGGERQRICIARAFLKDAPILLLDEPTSAVDTRTESEILDALERLMAGRTTFMIAHRLWALRRADLILVVDKGRIVEQGTHLELLQKGGLYSQLHQMQSGRVDSPPLIDGAAASDLACPKCGKPMFRWQQSPREETFLCHHCMARLELPARLGVPMDPAATVEHHGVEAQPLRSEHE